LRDRAFDSLFEILAEVAAQDTPVAESFAWAGVAGLAGHEPSAGDAARSKAVVLNAARLILATAQRPLSVTQRTGGGSAAYPLPRTIGLH
jgi:hypothetical protein